MTGKICDNCGYIVGKKYTHVVGKDKAGKVLYSCEEVLEEEYGGD